MIPAFAKRPKGQRSESGETTNDGILDQSMSMMRDNHYSLFPRQSPSPMPKRDRDPLIPPSLLDNSVEAQKKQLAYQLHLREQR